MENNLVRHIFDRLQKYFKPYDIALVNIDEDNSVGYVRSKFTSGSWILQVKDNYGFNMTWSWASIEECIYAIFRVINQQPYIRAFDSVRFLENLTKIESIEELTIKLDILGI